MQLCATIVLSMFLVSAFANAEDCTNLNAREDFVLADTCPEHCRFGTWRAQKNIEVFDRPEGKRIGQLPQNESFETLRGQTYIRPTLAKVVDTPPPELRTKIKMGDSFYVLAYEGEGITSVCINGKVDRMDCSGIQNYPLCKAVHPWALTEKRAKDLGGIWWVQIKFKKLSGWIRHDDQAVSGSSSAEPL